MLRDPYQPRNYGMLLSLRGRLFAPVCIYTHLNSNDSLQLLVMGMPRKQRLWRPPMAEVYG